MLVKEYALQNVMILCEQEYEIRHYDTIIRVWSRNTVDFFFGKWKLWLFTKDNNYKQASEHLG